MSDIDNIDIANKKIIIKLAKVDMVCPYCGVVHLKSKGTYNRTITIPSSIFDNYEIILSIRRYYCEDCHHSVSDTRSLAPANKKISYNTIFKIMEMLKSHRITFKDAAEATGVSPSTVVRVFDEHCIIPRIELPEVICMDEVYTKNNDFDSKYSCLFYDFYDHRLIDVTPSRRLDYLEYYLSNIPKEERDRVKIVSIDMYKTYRTVIKRYFKKAIISADSFHVIKLLNDSFETIRIRVMKRYDPSSNEYYLLKKFNFLLKDRTLNLDNEAKYNHKLEVYINLRGIYNILIEIDEELTKAYYLKEMYMDFNRDSSKEEARLKLDDIRKEFIESNIKEYWPFITALKNWREEIINSFTIYKGRRINNGVAESINAKVSSLIFNTKGITNNRRRRKRILYAVNGEGFKLK